MARSAGPRRARWNAVLPYRERQLSRHAPTDTLLNVPLNVPVVDITATGPGRTPMQQIMDLMHRHGPVFVRRLHGRDTLFVSDLDLVTDLADERRFAKHVGPALENVRAFAADGLFTAYNDEPNWAKAHDILMPAFALGSLRTYHPVMLKVARRLIEGWDRGARAGQSVNVPDDMTRMTLDTIGLAGFDYDFGSFERAEPHPFVESMDRCLEWSMTRPARVPGNDYSAADADFRADADYLAQVVDDVIAARAGADQGEAQDLLGLMLSAEHPADGTKLDAANIRNQVITFLIAGTRRPPAPCRSRCTTWPSTPRCSNSCSATWTCCGATRRTRSRRTTRSAGSPAPAKYSTRRFGCGPPPPRSVGTRSRTRCSADASRSAPGRPSPWSPRCCTGSPAGATTPSCSTPRASSPRRRRPVPCTPSSPSEPVNVPASGGSSRCTRRPCCSRCSSTATASTTTRTTDSR